MKALKSGLSWATVLKKRQGYKAAFDNFDIDKVAAYDDDKVEALVLNPDIIRHRQKISSTINNARCILKIQQEFGSFDRFIWSFVNQKPIQNCWKDMSEVPAKSSVSDAMSKELKKRGLSL